MPNFLSAGALTPSITQTAPQEASLLQHARGLQNVSTPDKIRLHAQEFESILLSQWLEQARDTFVGLPGDQDEESDDSGQGQMLSLGTQALATAVTKSGGIGVARFLVKYLENQALTSSPAITKK